MPDDFVKLAERVEALEGPCREVEALIWCALHGKRYQGHNQAYGSDETQVEYTEPPKRTRRVTGTLKGDNQHAPRWTASIDAAMTLADVAEDPLDILEAALVAAREERDGIYFLPLHICAAALRALAHNKERGE